jgi:hypothetical protein
VGDRSYRDTTMVEIIFLISEGRYNQVLMPGDRSKLKKRNNHKVECGLLVV